MEQASRGTGIFGSVCCITFVLVLNRYSLSHIERLPSSWSANQLKRKAVLDPNGEDPQQGDLNTMRTKADNMYFM
jgi:hypothetical protein